MFRGLGGEGGGGGVGGPWSRQVCGFRVSERFRGLRLRRSSYSCRIFKLSVHCSVPVPVPFMSILDASQT